MLSQRSGLVAAFRFDRSAIELLLQRRDRDERPASTPSRKRARSYGSATIALQHAPRRSEDRTQPRSRQTARTREQRLQPRGGSRVQETYRTRIGVAVRVPGRTQEVKYDVREREGAALPNKSRDIVVRALHSATSWEL